MREKREGAREEGGKKTRSPLPYILEEVDLGIGKLFSLANVQGFWHKLWPA